MKVSYLLPFGMLSCFIIAVSSCSGAVTVEASWDTARAILSQEGVRKKIHLRLNSSEKVKGRVVLTTSESIHVSGKDNEIHNVNEIHSIRVFPLVARKKIYRTLSVIGGVPAGIGAGIITAELCCDIVSGDGGESNFGEVVFFATWAGVQAILYRIGSRFDRGSIDIVLTDRPKSDSPGVLQELMSNPRKRKSP